MGGGQLLNWTFLFQFITKAPFGVLFYCIIQMVTQRWTRDQLNQFTNCPLNAPLGAFFVYNKGVLSKFHLMKLIRRTSFTSFATIESPIRAQFVKVIDTKHGHKYCKWSSSFEILKFIINTRRLVASPYCGLRSGQKATIPRVLEQQARRERLGRFRHAGVEGVQPQ